MESSYDIVPSLRRTRDDLNEQQKSAMDRSPKLNEDTDRRDCRQTRQQRRRNLNHHQNYNNLTRYERLNVGSSTSQATMQNTESRNKSSSQSQISRRQIWQSQIFKIQKKIDAINRIRNGECKAAVARDINVPESTLRGWCKVEEKIRSQLNTIALENNKHIMSPTSSSDNNDNSPAIDTVRMSNISVLSHPLMRASENHEHIPKTSNSDNNDNNPAINTGSTSNISAISPALYELFLKDQLLRSYSQLANDTIMKASLDLYNSSLSISGQSSLAASFPNDDPFMHRSNDVNADVTMANMMPTSNALVNASIHTEDPTIPNISSPYTERSFENIPQISNRRLSNSLSSEFSDPSGSIPQLTNSRTSPVLSTSRNNGNVITTISSKLSKPCKRLSTAICQQQQGFLPPVPAYTREDDMSNNEAISKHNNNVNNEISKVGYYPNLEISNRRLSNSLSPESSDLSGSISQLTSNRTSSVSSTSRNNGKVVTTISSKSSKNRKKLSTIVCQLQQDFLPPIPANGTGKEDMSNSNNNNNNIDYVNNKMSNQNSNSLPPNFSEILSSCIKVLEWLENYGSAVCTFQQAAQMRTIFNNLIHFVNSKEIRDRANNKI